MDRVTASEVVGRGFNSRLMHSCTLFIFAQGELIMIQKSHITVRYGETDQMGIAHHSNYAVWFEVARTDYIKNAGISYTDIEKKGIIMPLSELTCKYRQASFYEDELTIFAKVTKLTPVRVVFSYEVMRESTDTLIATGTTTHGFVSKELVPVNMKKNFPEIYHLFLSSLESC